MKTEGAPLEEQIKQQAPTKGEWSMVVESDCIEIRSEEKKRTICEIRDAGEKDIANAQMIVKAVNMHERLIEALREVLSSHSSSEHSFARNILAQAEQK